MPVLLGMNLLFIEEFFVELLKYSIRSRAYPMTYKQIVAAHKFF